MTATKPKLPTWKVDQVAAMGYLKILESPIKRTQEYGPFNVDYDIDGNLVGIEVFL